MKPWSYCLAGLLAGVAGGVCTVAAGGGGNVAHRRADVPGGASQPSPGRGNVVPHAATTATAGRLPEVVYPPDTLVAASARAAESLRARLDDTCTVTVHPPFVIAGDMPLGRLQQYASWSVLRPAEVMWAAYFKNKPDKVITVLLLTGERSYRSWAKRLFGDTDVAYFGYYRPELRTLVMNISTGAGTLVHELTHALIVYDFPTVPTWFNEGLASLHEQCTVGDSDITGLTNWRLPGLQEAVRAGRLRPLRELLTCRDFYGRLQGLNYAQARYFVMYRQQMGLLKKFYAHFRDLRGKDSRDTAGVEAIEYLFGKAFKDIEKGFLDWVAGLKAQASSASDGRENLSFPLSVQVPIMYAKVRDGPYLYVGCLASRHGCVWEHMPTPGGRAGGLQKAFL